MPVRAYVTESAALKQKRADLVFIFSEVETKPVTVHALMVADQAPAEEFDEPFSCLAVQFFRLLPRESPLHPVLNLKGSDHHLTRKLALALPLFVQLPERR